MTDWKENTLAELIHGPCDGAEIVLPPRDNLPHTIEIPLVAHRPIRVGIYRHDYSTLRVHTITPDTVKFRYQETRDDKEDVI